MKPKYKSNNNRQMMRYLNESDSEISRLTGPGVRPCAKSLRLLHLIDSERDFAGIPQGQTRVSI